MRSEETTRAPRSPGRYAVLIELGLGAVAFLAYLAVGRYTADSTAQAIVHAHDVLRLEQRLGLDWEHSVQDVTTAIPWWSEVVTQFYVWAYFPTVVPVVVWLYLRHREVYRSLRNALAASGVVGLVVYAVYPCAPPWIGGSGYTDTVAQGPFYDVARPGGVTNHLGALPSFHVGWVILVAVAVHRAVRSPRVRSLAVAWPLMMAYAVVATGNHWVLDLPAGAALAAIGLLAASVLDAVLPRVLRPVLGPAASRSSPPAPTGS